MLRHKLKNINNSNNFSHKIKKTINFLQNEKRHCFSIESDQRLISKK